MPIRFVETTEPPPPPLFFGSRQKVQQAKRHINDLDWKIRAFKKRKPYRFVIEPQSDSERFGLVFRAKEEIPPEVALMLGDAIHNLRSALDLLACELVKQNGGEIDRVAFPIARDRESFEKKVKNGAISQAAPAIIETLRSLKPYRGEDGDENLVALQDLDNADKHRLLIPTCIFTNTGDFVPEVTGVPNFWIGNIPVINPIDGTVLITFPVPEEKDVNYNFKPPFEICFGNGQVFEHMPIVPTLNQLTDLVERIISIFEKHVKYSQ